MSTASPADPTLWPATRQAAAIRAGELTSRDLLERVLDRVAAVNPKVNAVVTMDVEGARTAADAADRALGRGAPAGPLHGVPITIKDALMTAGMRSTGGATELGANVPARDAPAVAAVRAAGAIIYGKTNLPRWSGDIQSYNALFGTTSNPWDLARVPGGSSGGAAAAVACGMSAFEIGTDIGGSIRFPSAFNGVFGHKPSFGIVPSSGYLDHPLGGTTEADVNVLGPIARSADDLELLLDVLLRTDRPWPLVLPAAPADVRRMRVAAWTDDPFCPVDDEVRDVLDATVDALEQSGVAVDRRARPDLDPGAASTIGMSLVSAAMTEASGTRHPTHVEWLQWHRIREGLRQRWAEFFARFDAVLMPVCFVPPFEHQQTADLGARTLVCNGRVRPYLDVVRWTILTGMAYLPATVPPVGLGRGGLPIGVQVVGGYGQDRTTLRLAAHLAQLRGGCVPPPLVRGT